MEPQICLSEDRDGRRLNNIRHFLQERGIPFRFWEENDCGSVEFDHRGLHYHVWEFPAPERGAESNVRTAGRSEEFGEDYENEILTILKNWEGMQ